MSAVVVAAAASPSAARAAATLGFRTRFVHGESAASDILSVQGCNGGFRFSVIWHLDKAETTGTPGVPVCYYRDAIHSAVRFEKLAELGFSGTEREITDKDFFHDRPRN
jgi:hypothetical protein